MIEIYQIQDTLGNNNSYMIFPLIYFLLDPLVLVGKGSSIDNTSSTSYKFVV